MMKRINDKSLNSPTKHLVINNNPISDVKEIANMLADTFAGNSSILHYSEKFQSFKALQERNVICFKSDDLEDYNLPFSLRELQDSLDSSLDTTPGPDDIAYEMLRHLSQYAIEILLTIFNNDHLNMLLKFY